MLCEDLERGCFDKDSCKSKPYIVDVSGENYYCCRGASYIRQRYAELDLPDPIPDMDEQIDKYIREKILGKELVGLIESKIESISPGSKVTYSFSHNIERCIGVNVSGVPSSLMQSVREAIRQCRKTVTSILSITLV